MRLEPLAQRHADDLWEASRDPADLALAADRPAADARRVAGAGWTTRAARVEAGLDLAFATVLVATGRAVGSTRFLALRPEHRSLEIGWTWLAPTAWGTGANTEAKLLQLEHAFDVLGCRRVEFKTDALNERARPALAGLPARSRASTASTCSCATARTATPPGTASSTTSGRPCARRSASASRAEAARGPRPTRARGCIVEPWRRGWRSGRARSARRPAACGSRSRTAASRASAATRTTRSRRGSSAPRARRSARSTRIPTASADRSCAATARTSR